MSTASHSQLGDSWIVDDARSDVSWAEDSPSSAPASQPEQDRTFREMKQLPEETDQISHKSHPRPHVSVPEPEFIMPAIDHEASPSQRQVRQRKPTTPSRKMTPSKAYPGARNPKHSSRPVQNASRASTTGDQTMDVFPQVVGWFLDILGNALTTIKKPISWVLAAYLLAGLGIVLRNLLTSSIYAALSPICRVPGMSLLHLPMCEYTSPGFDTPTISSTSAPVEFDALMNTQSHFEEIMSESAAGVSLPMDMKRSETSIRDLRQIVRYSQLASRNELVLEFDGFIETARMASYDLQKFNSHVGRGVDIVLSTARWTQRVLDDMDLKQVSRGVVPSFFQDTLLAPFKPVQFTEHRLLDQYIKHTRIVSDEIDRLIDEAQALLLILQNLEDRLEVIHSVAMHDNIAAQASKDEILTHLWTLLGGNRAKLGKYNNQLTLLRQVGQYRKVAWAHITATILTLQRMGTELEELRTRVGSAELLREQKEIPLSVHIESIRLGVERLEEGRTRARELEEKHVRRVVDGVEEHIKGLGSS
ncbi:uncharacterized protein A1O9_08168 [Exophiala aquamarina CBS 119918]|uniref:Uncharacterized protein n=1 Tax=Exophiala aquamarina CBS 119918 TaxID=1182545 RepID=A0A072P807_9EURO|nr:uncharacterized protein A1O9_08168 [Exophiala aquamarina CBS 119918]KEF55418.1 hypothetical protein A1O9_08168 [Exophiala aquamarina CBS 119918]